MNGVWSKEMNLRWADHRGCPHADAHTYVAMRQSQWNPRVIQGGAWVGWSIRQPDSLGNDKHDPDAFEIASLRIATHDLIL